MAVTSFAVIKRRRQQQWQRRPRRGGSGRRSTSRSRWRSWSPRCGSSARISSITTSSPGSSTSPSTQVSGWMCRFIY